MQKYLAVLQTTLTVAVIIIIDSTSLHLREDFKCISKKYVNAPFTTNNHTATTDYSFSL